jgi:Fe-S cluster biogenesis protein NfuA
LNRLPSAIPADGVRRAGTDPCLDEPASRHPANRRKTQKGEIMREKVEEVINKIRPMLKADGGDVELVDVGADGIVKVRLQGACAGCPMSQMTLKNGIEKLLKKEIPEVKSVESA